MVKNKYTSPNTLATKPTLGTHGKEQVHLTEHSGHKAQGELGGEEGEEPGGGVQRWGNLVLLKVVVEILVVVMDQTHQLVQPHLSMHTNTGKPHCQTVDRGVECAEV